MGDRLSSLDAQIKEGAREIDEARYRTDEMIVATRKRIVSLEEALVLLAEEARKISGDMSDVELAWKHLPLKI